MRIDKDILNKHSNLSRAYIKEQIKLGNILVSGKKVKPSYVLREGDLVAFAPGFILPERTKIQPNPEIKLNIIYENSDVIVIDKPAGISVHPRQTKTGAPLAKEITNTLVSGLLAHYPKTAKVGDGHLNLPQPLLKEGNRSLPLGRAGEDFSPINIRPGIVHRLDKDTSGVMIIAKNQKSFDWLKKQFKERKVFKKYIALVYDQLKNDEGVIKTYLTGSKSDPSKQKVLSPVAGSQVLSEDRRPKGRAGVGGREREAWPPADSKGKLREAITGYKVIKKFKDYCLIEAYPKTGRLHQIRVQFAWLGNPVAGDTKYGPRKRPSPLNLKRQFLHAAELKITLPDGQKKTFSSPLPTELTQISEGLKKN